MRYLAYGLAILAGFLPRDATASHSEPNYTAVR